MASPPVKLHRRRPEPSAPPPEPGLVKPRRRLTALLDPDLAGFTRLLTSSPVARELAVAPFPDLHHPASSSAITASSLCLLASFLLAAVAPLPSPATPLQLLPPPPRLGPALAAPCSLLQALLRPELRCDQLRRPRRFCGRAPRAQPPASPVLCSASIAGDHDQHPLVGEPPPHASLRPGHHLPDALADAARPPSPPCCWHPEAL
nr:proline-rich receptor-like protein kinase PERK10 [Aegilops tauschii subsp. strangulata]